MLQNSVVKKMLKTWDYWVFGLCPLSGILKYSKEHISATGSLSVVR
jgi:hypothetical protein